MQQDSASRRKFARMIDLPYSLVIEATAEPDCLYKARWGVREHVELLTEQNSPCRSPLKARRSRFKMRIGQRRTNRPDDVRTPAYNASEWNGGIPMSCKML